jgi:gamma-glutamyltranspeptidase / glutathione hydrolase
VQQASDAPRWKVMGGRRVMVERGWTESTLQELRKRGHAIEFAAASEFGGAQLIQRVGDSYAAGSDHRKDGHAAGF